MRTGGRSARRSELRRDAGAQEKETVEFSPAQRSSGSSTIKADENGGTFWRFGSGRNRSDGAG